MSSTAMVRALHGAARVPSGHPPYDTLHFRLHYPARWTGSDAERLTGVLPADTGGAPWPLAIVLPGINVGADGYRWLACTLASAGVATATFDLVEEVMPGTFALSPGLDITAVMPDAYGTRPSATALQQLVDAVRALCTTGPTAGLVDCDRVLLIGHSAGGTVALENTSDEWFPWLRGVVTYGAHTMPAVALGHPQGTVLSMPGALPALLIAGTDDGVIRSSADRYRAGEQHDPVRRTFLEGCPHPASRLAVLSGANHMVMVDNGDTTTARGFLDGTPTADSIRRDGEVRCLMAGMITAFARAVLSNDRFAGTGAVDTSEVDTFATHSGIESWEAK